PGGNGGDVRPRHRYLPYRRDRGFHCDRVFRAICLDEFVRGQRPANGVANQRLRFGMRIEPPHSTDTRLQHRPLPPYDTAVEPILKFRDEMAIAVATGRNNVAIGALYHPLKSRYVL